MAYLALVRPMLEYGATVWDSQYKTDIDKLERIQARAARFIKQDYRSMEPGCVGRMLTELELPSLQFRRRNLRLTTMYKVVGGLVPAMPPHLFFTEKPANKRQVRAKKFEEYQASNIITRAATNNTKPFIVPKSKTEQYKNSFFVQTVIDWNQLEDVIVTADSVESFKTKVGIH